MNQKNRILIVDDSPSFRKSLRALLDIQPDLTVVAEAANGPQALDQVEEFEPDLILLDAQMPGMSGVEVTQWIKQHLPKIKVILMTMYPDYRSKSIEAGADAFLTKGVPPEALLDVVRGISQKSD